MWQRLSPRQGWHKDHDQDRDARRPLALSGCRGRQGHHRGRCPTTFVRRRFVFRPDVARCRLGETQDLQQGGGRGTPRVSPRDSHVPLRRPGHAGTGPSWNTISARVGLGPRGNTKGTRRTVNWCGRASGPSSTCLLVQPSPTRRRPRLWLGRTRPATQARTRPRTRTRTGKASRMRPNSSEQTSWGYPKCREQRRRTRLPPVMAHRNSPAPTPWMGRAVSSLAPAKPDRGRFRERTPRCSGRRPFHLR